MLARNASPVHVDIAAGEVVPEHELRALPAVTDWPTSLNVERLSRLRLAARISARTEPVPRSLRPAKGYDSDHIYCVEAEFVDVLLDQYAESRAAAVSGVAQRQQQVRPAVSRLGLHPGHHLHRIVRRRLFVVHRRHERDRRVRDPWPDVVVRRVPSEVRTLDRILGRAELDGRGPR